jgi:3-deoxy-D-manno-octulosonic-acid transferase
MNETAILWIVLKDGVKTERTQELIDICKKYGYEHVLFSKTKNENIQEKIIIVDVIGHLKELYSIASVVFVGGSLVKKGGHNIVEPAIFSKPIIFGKYMNNFRVMAKNFVEAKAAIQLKNNEELCDTISYALENKEEMRNMGEQAFLIILENRGAVASIMSEISEYMQVNH